MVRMKGSSRKATELSIEAIVLIDKEVRRNFERIIRERKEGRKRKKRSKEKMKWKKEEMKGKGRGGENCMCLFRCVEGRKKRRKGEKEEKKKGKRKGEREGEREADNGNSCYFLDKTFLLL
jgi:hypothetical protein